MKIPAFRLKLSGRITRWYSAPSLSISNYEGAFSTVVPISIPGEYEVSFTDAKGFIGTRIITATGPQTPVATLSEAAVLKPWYPHMRKPPEMLRLTLL